MVCYNNLGLHLSSTCKYETVIPAFVMLILSPLFSSIMLECSEKPALYSTKVFFLQLHMIDQGF